VLDEAIDWFYLKGKAYQRLRPSKQGILKSRVFRGLWLDPAALVRRDLAEVLAVLQQGLATPEHTRFVDRLQQAKSRR
jgi:hypothetical protein